MPTKPPSPEPGGFFHPILPSPPASSTTAASVPASSLPQPRARPLKPGSSKESSFIDYVDRELLDISRRYEKRFNTGMEGNRMPKGERMGYEGFGEVGRDLERVVDVVWVSGTRISTLNNPVPCSLLIACCCLKHHYKRHIYSRLLLHSAPTYLRSHFLHTQPFSSYTNLIWRFPRYCKAVMWRQVTCYLALRVAGASSVQRRRSESEVLWKNKSRRSGGCRKEGKRR